MPGLTDANRGAFQPAITEAQVRAAPVGDTHPRRILESISHNMLGGAAQGINGIRQFLLYCGIAPVPGSPGQPIMAMWYGRHYARRAIGGHVQPQVPAAHLIDPAIPENWSVKIHMTPSRDIHLADLVRIAYQLGFTPTAADGNDASSIVRNMMLDFMQQVGIEEHGNPDPAGGGPAAPRNVHTYQTIVVNTDQSQSKRKHLYRHAPGTDSIPDELKEALIANVFNPAEQNKQQEFRKFTEMVIEHHGEMRSFINNANDNFLFNVHAYYSKRDANNQEYIDIIAKAKRVRDINDYRTAAGLPNAWIY